MKEPVELIADSFMVRGPKQTDGSYTISFTTGEYMQDKVASVIKTIPPMTAVKITIQEYEG